jgi:hypothetical protein
MAGRAFRLRGRLAAGRFRPSASRIRETIAADFKHLAAAAPYFQPAHFHATFETGLEILLEGIRWAHGDWA